MKIKFYISGHGYGHAVRDIEIIKALTKQEPQIQVDIRTSAPFWLFEPILNDNITFFQRDFDFGIRQNDSFSANKKETLKAYAELMHLKQTWIVEEAEHILQEHVNFVISDITPFAFDVAEMAGVPAFAIGNFSWDWIYSEYLTEYPEYQFVVDNIKKSYNKTARLFRLPFYGDMSAFPVIEDVPLVGRQAATPADEIRKKMNVKKNEKLVLLGLRMNDMHQVNWRALESFEHGKFVAISRSVDLPNLVHLNEGDFAFHDVLNACDAVISKPGYSMVSEVIVNQTPIVYVPRQDFAEDPFLRQGLNQYAVSQEMPIDQFYAGEWGTAFEQLFQQKQKWPEISINGADFITKRLLELTR